MDIALQCINQLRIIHIIGKHIPHPSQEKNSSVQFIFVMTGRVTDVCTFNIPPTYRLPRQRNNTPRMTGKSSPRSIIRTPSHRKMNKTTCRLPYLPTEHRTLRQPNLSFPVTYLAAAGNKTHFLLPKDDWHVSACFHHQ